MKRIWLNYFSYSYKQEKRVFIVYNFFSDLKIFFLILFSPSKSNLFA